MTTTQTICVFLSFILWMIISLILVLSIIGLLLFVRSDNTCSTWEGEDGVSSWYKIGKKLYTKLTS